MKPRSLRLLLIAVLLALLLPATASGVGPYPPIADDVASLTDSAAAINNETSLGVTGSGPSGCTTALETFLKFDLTGIGTIGSATLTLRANFLSASGSLTMRLYGVQGVDTGWTEGVGQILWAGRPGPRIDLGTTAAAVAAGNDLVFGTSPAFVSFLNGERTADGTATVIVTVDSCTTTGSISQGFDSKEKVSGVDPLLALFGPTPVTLSTFHASDKAPLTWPLYAVIITLSILAAGSVAYVVRRRLA